MKRRLNVWKGVTHEKLSPILLLLVVLNTVAMLVSNIITCKVFAFGNLGVLPAGVIVFPIIYILSDLFSELSYKWTRRTCHIAFAANLLMVMFFSIAIAMPGIDPEKASAMELILGNTPWALAASLTAYFAGDLLNDVVFQKMKEKDGEKKFALRAIVSSLVGELVDSGVYIPLGMNILPKAFLGFEFMTWDQIAVAIPLQACFKTVYEIVILPVTTVIVKKLKTLNLVEEN